jgi:hypothetical protein
MIDHLFLAVLATVNVGLLVVVLWVLRDMRRDSLHYHRTTGAVLTRIWQDIQGGHR